MGQHTRPEQRRHLVEAWRRSELTAAAFARSRRIAPSNFHRWVRELDVPPPGPTRAAPVAFLELRQPEAPRDIFVTVHGHALRFAEPPPVGWFARLIAELGAC